MCGIAGAFTFSPDYDDASLKAMSDALTYRGPDSSGQWFERKDGIWLAHRRLAIIDLTPAGHQPMLSQDGRFVLTFNGEIYNYLELRKLLADRGVSFKGHSDTEVILEGFARLGIDQTLEKISGMFAIGLWDREQKSLRLLRDRTGMKPLYYWKNGREIYFASELKSLCALPFFPRKLRTASLDTFFRYGYVAAPHTIYEDVHEVAPGQWIEFSAQGENREVYWSAEEQFARARQPGQIISDEREALEGLEYYLGRAVDEHMISDVPAGAFLSGGIDSSLIVALARKKASGPVRTFSIGFEEALYDESTHAEAVAGHLGTDHVTEICTAGQALEIIPRLADMYDQPFWDSSAIPTFLVSQIARKHVTVALSGDAGDELFGGYNRYFWSLQMAKMQQVSGPLMPLAGKLLRAMPESGIDHLQKMLLPVLGGPLSRPELGRRLHKLADIMARPPLEQFQSHLSICPSPLHPLKNKAYGSLELQESGVIRSISRHMMLHDFCFYLPYDILTKVDRASMAVSLESRIPFLDHRLVEWSFRLDDALLLRPGRGKLLLRKLLDRYVPESLIERPKMGFGVPIHEWFRGPLKKSFTDLAEASRQETKDFIDYDLIQKIFEEHLSGRKQWGHPLWSYYVFFQWIQRWKPSF